MNKDTVKGDSIETLLRQMGASEITKVRGTLYFIKFKLDEDLNISYVYNINAKNKYFLQRIKPYPIPEGVFTDEYKIVSFIKKDLNKFMNATNSSNFQLFLDVTKKVNSLANSTEDLFLNYNVNRDDFIKLNKGLNNLLKHLEESKINSKKL